MENIGIVYGQLDQTKISREYLNKALLKYKEINNLFGISKILNNLGVSYSKTDSKKTLEYYSQALEIAQQNNLIRLLPIYTNNIGGIYEDNGKFKEALSYYKAALETSQKNNNVRYIPFFFKTHWKRFNENRRL